MMMMKCIWMKLQCSEMLWGGLMRIHRCQQKSYITLKGNVKRVMLNHFGSSLITKSLKMNDLLVVGAGHLGARVAVLWKEKFPESKIFLKTKSDNAERTEKWRALGYEPFACSESLESIPKCPYVVYSVPPTSGCPLHMLTHLTWLFIKDFPIYGGGS